MSASDFDMPVETTIAFDNRDAQNYQYHYSDMKSPVLTLGARVKDQANFRSAEIRDCRSNVANKFKAAQLRTV